MIKYLKNQTLEAILWLFSSLIIVSALVYRIYALNWIGVIISLVLALSFWLGLISLISRGTNYPARTKIQVKLIGGWNLILLIAYPLIALGALYVLWQSRSDGALVSPWTVVPGYFFLLYGLATAILLTLIIRAQKNTALHSLNFILIAIHYLLSFIVAVIVYKIGYGYDPFVHQATMELIDKQGAVDPKPFYYLGQYGLIITIHKLTGLSIIILDKLLVPVLAALFIPLALKTFIRKHFANNPWSQLLFLTALIIPFGFFILSTPQNLAWFFLLLAVLYSSTDYRLTLVLALATCLIHPLAGIPALALGLLLLTQHYSLKIGPMLTKMSYIITWLLVFLGIPLAFYLSGQAQITWSLNSYSSFLITLAPHFSLPYQESWWLNLVYFFGQNLQLIITLLILSGVIIIYRRHDNNFKLTAPLIIAIATLGAYFLVSQLSFNLIAYEQNDFAQRLIKLIVILCLPAIIIFLENLTDKVLEQNKFYRRSALLLLIALITTSLYLSYPRSDHYYNSKAYAVSASDQLAVNWIESQATKPYIVLANQQTSAMALRTFGFNRYQNGVYFYPIPTSGPLYQYFLSMVYDQASRETMTEAINLAQVDEAYFVLPKYWWAFSQILAEAKLSADSWQKIGEGQSYVFKYTR